MPTADKVAIVENFISMQIEREWELGLASRIGSTLAYFIKIKLNKTFIHLFNKLNI